MSWAMVTTVWCKYDDDVKQAERQRLETNETMLQLGGIALSTFCSIGIVFFNHFLLDYQTQN